MCGVKTRLILRGIDSAHSIEEMVELSVVHSHVCWRRMRFFKKKKNGQGAE